jgi:hypothetical protein
MSLALLRTNKWRDKQREIFDEFTRLFLQYFFASYWSKFLLNNEYVFRYFALYVTACHCSIPQPSLLLFKTKI